MNVIKEIERINANEFASGIVGGVGKGSWHDKYKDSAWVYLGGMTFELSEGDILCVMSQWGEVEDINLVRDKATNKSLGYAFVKYEDQRSTILAVDNFNGIKLLGRTLRCDHVDKYKLSKDVRKREEDKLDNDPEAEPDVGPGHAYNDQEMANSFSISAGTDVWGPVKSQQSTSSTENISVEKKSVEEKKSKKEKKVKKHHKESREKSRDKYDDHDRHQRKQKERVDTTGTHSSSSSRDGVKVNEKQVIDVDSRSNEKSHYTAPTSSHRPQFSSGAAASWRGARDPTLENAIERGQTREFNKSREGARRDEFSGMGGMKRTR